MRRAAAVALAGCALGGAWVPGVAADPGPHGRGPGHGHGAPPGAPAPASPAVAPNATQASPAQGPGPAPQAQSPVQSPGSADHGRGHRRGQAPPPPGHSALAPGHATTANEVRSSPVRASASSAASAASAAAPVAQTAAPSPAATPTSAPTPAIPATAATSPAPPVQGPSESPPAARVSPHRAGRHHGRPGGSAGARRRAGSAFSTLPTARGASTTGAAPSPVLAGSGHATAKSRHVMRPHRPAPPAAVPAALLRTITRIVDVVPLPLRLVIGLLVALAASLGLSSRLSSLRARRLERQRRDLLEDVGLLQAALLPSIPPSLGEIAASVAYRPADGPGAGGDFYDVFELVDGRIAVIVGDLSGHGRRALPHTALVRFTLRAHLEAGASPRHALQSAAPILERQLGDSFATVVVAVYDPAERTLVYATAGHPVPAILGAQPLRRMAGSGSPPIGVGMPTGLRQTTVALPGRATLCFFTDGLVEARSDGRLLGTEGLEEVLAELGPDARAAGLLDAIAARSDERRDDMAACVLHIMGKAKEPVVVGEELELLSPDMAPVRIERFLAACGAGAAAIARAHQAALPRLQASRSVILDVGWGAAAAPEVVVRHGELALLHRPATDGAERRRMAR